MKSPHSLLDYIHKPMKNAFPCDIRLMQAKSASESAIVCARNTLGCSPKQLFVELRLRKISPTTNESINGISDIAYESWI